MITITAEEIEIIVTAKVTQALKEFKKLVPGIKQELSKVQTLVNSTDFKGLANKVKSSGVDKEISKVSKKMKQAFDPGDTSGIKLFDSNGLRQQISGISKEFQNLKGSNEQLGNAIELQKYKKKIEELKTAVQQASKEVSKLGYVKYDTNAIEDFINNYNTMPQKKVNKTPKGSTNKTKNIQMKVNTDSVKKAETELNKLDVKKKKIESNSRGNIFSSIFSSIKGMMPQMNSIYEKSAKIRETIRSWSGCVKLGIGQVLKYATALFGLQSIYSILSSCASSWLSSQNAGAKQLSANIEYMKYAMRKCPGSSNTIYY